MDILKKFSLKDKTAVITGGTGLLGSVYTHSLLSLGASVIVIDKKIDKTKFIKNFILNLKSFYPFSFSFKIFFLTLSLIS